MKTIAIIDDELHVREDIREKINTYFENKLMIVGEASSIEEGISLIQNKEPDIVLLDIHFNEGSGFDILTRIDSKRFELIFVTGYDTHAIKAIKIGALDYILKPVDDEEFCEALNKAIKNKEKNNPLDKLIEISHDFFKGAEKKRIILKTTDTVYAVFEKDILFCRSNGNYTTFYTRQMERIMISKPLKKVEELLSDSIFVRCHQSYIVNKNHVSRYNKKGVLIVHLDFKVPVSGRRKEYVLSKVFNQI